MNDTAPPNANFHCEVIEQRKSEDCGCPEEFWRMGNVEVTLHLERDGTGHIIVEAGDWERDWETTHTGMADLRQKAADFLMSLPCEKNGNRDE